MRLLFGGTQLGVTNGTRVEPSRRLLRNKADLGYGFAWTLDADAYLKLSDNNADTTAQMAAVETALAAPSGDLRFQYDDGTDTRNSWLTAATFTGVRATFLAWTGDPGAQFRTWRSFKCRFEWEEIFPLSAGFLLDFTETVRIRGGVPAYVVNEAVNGAAPQARGTVARTAWFATQSGKAVGLSQWPIPAMFPPLWGFTSPPLKDTDIQRVSPERKGDPAKYRGYEVSWNYSFESAGSLELDLLGNQARPALWV